MEVSFGKDGGSIRLSYPSEEAEGGQMVVEKRLSGLVSPDECSWVIDEDDKGRRCVCMSLMKRRRTTSESTWWSRLFKEEEAKSLPKVKALEQAKERVETELARLTADFTRAQAEEAGEA